MGQVQGIGLPVLLTALLRIAEETGKHLKGGKKSRRDRWFGLEDKPGFSDFRDWWHRHGKEEAGGADIQSREEALTEYEAWLSTQTSEPGS